MKVSIFFAFIAIFPCYGLENVTYPIYGIELKRTVVIDGKSTRLFDSQMGLIKARLYDKPNETKVSKEVTGINSIVCNFEGNKFNFEDLLSYRGIPAYQKKGDFYKVKYDGKDFWLKVNEYFEVVPLFERLSKRFYLHNLKDFEKGHFFYEKERPVKDLNSVFKKISRPKDWKAGDGMIWDTGEEIVLEVKSVEKLKDNIWFELGAIQKYYAWEYVGNRQKIFFRFFNDEGKSDVVLGGCGE